MTTNKQKAAIHLCEQFLHISYVGDIEDKDSISQFLSIHLKDAKDVYEELKCEYEAYLWDMN